MNLLKYRLSRSAILNLLLVAFLILLLVNPGAKATLIEGLMKLGFYNPDVPSTETAMALKPGSEGVSFRDGDGKVVSLNSLKGKVVFINFWATWCPPCRAEMPSINKVFKKYGENSSMNFIMVDADSNFPKARKFLDRRGYHLPLFTVASEIPRDFFGGLLPTTLLLNKKGEIVFRHEGTADYNDKKFVDYIDKLLKE